MDQGRRIYTKAILQKITIATSKVANMSSLPEVEAEIASTKADYEQAKAVGNVGMMLMLGTNLAELRKKENRLTGAGNQNVSQHMLCCFAHLTVLWISARSHSIPKRY